MISTNGKGDKWRRTNFKKYWESDYWKNSENKKILKNGKEINKASEDMCK